MIGVNQDDGHGFLMVIPPEELGHPSREGMIK
jgi:hypothetical protein